MIHTITTNLSQDFIAFAVQQEVLRFGQFQTKSKRQSPYFFNAALFNNGAAIGRLAEFYATTSLASGITFDMLFGPAYKGITLAATTAVALAAQGKNIPFCSNRKEAKDHGEGGILLGAPLQGRVLIIDDVITAGTSVRESVNLIRAHGATPAGVLIALDRQERGLGALSALQEVESEFNLPVAPIARLTDVMAYIRDQPTLAPHLEAIAQYRNQYGVS